MKDLKIKSLFLLFILTLFSCSDEIEEENQNIDVVVPPTLEWVDLGLSVKWASHNVGATSPEGYGSYFAWGELTSKDSYYFNNNSTYNQAFSDISGNADYDAATANWGKPSRIPTNAEMEELKNNTIREWTTLNGVKGYKITSKTNGNSIFLPAAGFRFGMGLKNDGWEGYYWTSEPFESNDNNAYFLHLKDDKSSWNFNLNYGFRYNGQCVRPVSD